MVNTMLTIVGIILLSFVLLAIFTYPRVWMARDRLRWQLKTHQQLNKELSKGRIDLDTADEIITYPPYGISKDAEIDTSFSIFDEKKWEQRKVAKTGWEVTALFFIGIIMIVLTIGLLAISVLLLYSFIRQMDAAWPTIVGVVIFSIVAMILVILFILFSIRVLKTAIQMSRYPSKVKVRGKTATSVLFVTLVSSPEHLTKAQLLIDSIRSFGGPFSRNPIWIFESDPQRAPCEYLQDDDIRVISLKIPESVRGNYFAGKVYACAYAETWAEQRAKSLIWISPDCLVIKPPRLFDLDSDFDAALRPVHKQNLGLLAVADLNDFWKKVYEVVGVEDVQVFVGSFVDGRRIRAYYNSHAFAVNPAKGLLKRWFECFEKLMLDDEFQRTMSNDQQIFLHQAVLSTILATQINPDRVRILPPDYSYPYNLHGNVPVEWRAEWLNDLVSIVYEDRTLNPRLVTDINIDEPLRSWLSAQVDRT